MFFLKLMYNFLLLSGQTLAKFDPGAQDNVAIYWGQNSMKTHEEGAQQPLSFYCEDSNVDIILLAFVVAINDAKGNLEINFANQLTDRSCNNTVTHPYTCPGIGADIEACQKNDKTVLLSMGGAYASAETGFTSPETAKQGALKIWQMFGPHTNTSSIRPFGEAVVNGFDFDFEHEVRFVEDLGKELRDLTIKGSTQDKPFYLSAAPQCSATQLNSIIKATHFDMWFIQFYNDPGCDVRTHDKFKASIEQWNEWATNNKTSMFVGLAGGAMAAPSGGYLKDTDLPNYLDEAKALSKMRGAMLWDASQAWANEKYHVKVKQALAPNKQ
ncbi:glycoside hydrolase superfamily [Ampelomyces quisqualis]|uniref:chitinase n=1 Tax=Ampelomyces quisqualis TaxID=50730 RepID=A0A6A5QY51_AMPQU|nr:glycoside hydrolase superfamily [Ampelomyces quisqualis]